MLMKLRVGSSVMY